MINLFDIENGRVTFAPQAFLIQEFKALWDRDPTKDKRVAVQELAFVYFYSEPRSVYQTADEDEKVNSIVTDVITVKDWRPDQVVMAACAKYRELFTNESLLFLESARNAMHALTAYFNNVDFDERNSRGDPVYKVREITSALKDAEGLISSIQKMEQRIANDEDVQVTIRGGGSKGMMEDPEDA